VKKLARDKRFGTDKEKKYIILPLGGVFSDADKFHGPAGQQPHPADHPQAGIQGSP